MIGQTVGHFRILSRLGSGGMGVVYRAHDEKLQREIAIKVMSGESDRPDLDRLRIIEEARAASGLSHPHICTVYETGEFHGQAYIAMEYVEGRALSEMIPPGGLPPEAVIRYGIQVADALSHAHRRGIIHRDLKTSNVVVDADSRAKVLDFGLARRIALKTGAAVTRSSDLMPDGKLVGTLAYMAPEMLLQQTADERSDIWGLGVMLYEMASGEPPFKGRNEFEITAGILRAPADALPAHVPPMLRAIIQRCIAKEPGQRYQHAGEARAALEAIQSDVIAPASTSGRSHAIPRAADSGPVQAGSGISRRGIGIGVAFLTVVAVAVALVMWLQRDTRSPWERVASGGQLTLVVASEDPLVDPSVSLDGKMLAYIALDKQNTSDVFVRRVAGGSLVRITTDRAREGSPRFSPDGERLAFTRRESQTEPPEIRVVPSLGGDGIATIAAAADPRWSPSGTELAFLRPTISGGMQLVVSSVNGSNARVLLEPDSTFPFMREPAWAPDGQEIAIVRGSGGVAGEIWLVPRNGGTPRRAMSDPAEVFSHSPAYTADGLGIVHSSNRGGATNIWFYPRRGGAPVRLTAGPGPDIGPTVAADGTISFINSRWRNTLDVFSLRGVPTRVLTSHSPYLWGPAFSRDGKTIAFSRSEVDGAWHIWSIPADGGTPKRLTDTPSGEVYSRFTPDRASVLFHTWGTPRRIGLVPVDGGVPQMLDFGSASDAFPDMSPDGKWIAFTRTDADAEHVYIAPAGGGTPRLLTASPATVPRWSPDGRQIAFGANRNSTGGVFVIDPDGRNERRLTTTGGWPVWWPDGRQIGFMVPGRIGAQELHVVNRDGGTTRHLAEVVYSGSNHPFDVSPDGSRIVTTNAVHVSDEIWLLEPRVRQ